MELLQSCTKPSIWSTEITGILWNFEEIMYNFVISTVLADGLALVGAKTFADRVMAKLGIDIQQLCNSTTDRLLSEWLKIKYNVIIKWKHFLCYWLFFRGIHRWLVDSPPKGQWHQALMFSLKCSWNSWANNQDVSNLNNVWKPYQET